MRDVGFLPRRPGEVEGRSSEGGGTGGPLGWESQMFKEQPLCVWHCSGQKRKTKADKDPALREEHG